MVRMRAGAGWGALTLLVVSGGLGCGGDELDGDAVPVGRAPIPIVGGGSGTTGSFFLGVDGGTGGGSPGTDGGWSPGTDGGGSPGTDGGWSPGPADAGSGDGHWGPPGPVDAGLVTPDAGDDEDCDDNCDDGECDCSGS